MGSVDPAKTLTRLADHENQKKTDGSAEQNVEVEPQVPSEGKNSIERRRNGNDEPGNLLRDHRPEQNRRMSTEDGWNTTDLSPQNTSNCALSNQQRRGTAPRRGLLAVITISWCERKSTKGA